MTELAGGRTLANESRLDRLLPPELGPQEEEEPALLLWGVPVSGLEGERLGRRLEQVSDRLGERPRGRSEPDVIVAWEDGAVRDTSARSLHLRREDAGPVLGPVPLDR